jgi:hypothetical protein
MTRAGMIAVAFGISMTPVSFASGAEPAMTCSAPLSALVERWDAIAFSAPSKPAQMRVLGRDGRESSAAEVSYLSGQIRVAAKACREGR